MSEDEEKPKENKTLVKVVAIICLTAIEIVNILTVNVDGAVLGAICGIIGGIAGYEFKQIVKG